MRSTRLILMVLMVLGVAILTLAQEQKTEPKVVLPAAVAKAVTDNFPKAVPDNIDVEKTAGITFYDIEFKGGAVEIEVAEDGTVMDISTDVEMKDLPKAAADAIQKAADGATIKQIEKSELRAELKKDGEKGRIVKLERATFIYEAELMKGDQTGEIQVAPDGTIVEALKWGARGTETD
jgi:hypothetical protein